VRSFIICTHPQITLGRENQSKRGGRSRRREERKVYKVLVGKPERKTPLGRPRRRWEDGIRTNLG
jgi:hypothetical protein